MWWANLGKIDMSTEQVACLPAGQAGEGDGDCAGAGGSAV